MDETQTAMNLTSGTMVSYYRIVERIGAGGMGEVYLADDTRLNRKVAIKFLPAHLASNPEIKQRFNREAQAVAKLNHPNIVTIHDVNEINGRPYFVMEHVEGESLHHFAHEKPLPFDMVIEYAIQICQGLGEAHRAGIVHRDIKATNIAIDTRGRARLLDFGLASMKGDDQLTRTGSTLGTVSYMSPEQVSGREIDHRSDLFSLGIVLYELIAGRTPFRRESEGATLKAIIEDAPEPLTRYKADVPERLQAIFLKLLEKDRELRYQSAEGVIADLKKLFYDSQQSPRSTPRKIRKIKSRILIGGVGVCILIAAAILTLIPKSSGTRATPEKAIPMIAVLPFENLGAPEDEYFADGMTEEITSRLAGIRGLGVISRTSAMKYKVTDKSLSEIGRELGVDYILEGTVRWSKSGTQPKVRITPQLIRVNDDRHVWADNYERALLEIFAVQADIASQIVDQLDLTLLENDRDDLAERPTENAEAYEYYLKGLNNVRRQDMDLSTMMATTADLDRAVELDSMFALAWALRSTAYSMLAFVTKSPEHTRLARESAERSLELHPDLSQGHMALGTYYNLVETDYDRALTEFGKAKSEMHSDADLLSALALVQMRQGRFDEAQVNYRKAAELDPLNPARHAALAECLLFERSFPEAEQLINRAIALAPDQVEYYNQKTVLYSSWYGEWDKIEPVVREALKHVDTLEFFAENWWMKKWMPDVPFDSLILEYRNHRPDTVDDESFYMNLTAGFRYLGDTAASLIYADSAKTSLQKQLLESPDDAHRLAFLGMVLAVLGDCTDAVQYGLQGKDLLSVETCHW